MLPTTARIGAGAVALVAGTGLLVQFGASLGMTGGSASAALWSMLRFFTIITNLLVAMLFLAIACGGKASSRPFWLGGVTLMILLVGLVYGLLLQGLLHLSGGAKLADFLLHTMSPVIVALWWLIFAPKGGLRYADPLLWALPPLAYLPYAIWRGTMDGNYAYFFIDIPKLGWRVALANAGMIALCFILAGLALVWLDHRMSRVR